MTSIATMGASAAIWRFTTRGLRVAVVASAAASVSLIFAALAFFLLMILVAETRILSGALGEDFILVFFNALPVAVIAAVLDCFAVVGVDARRSSDKFAHGFAILLLALGVIALWVRYWFGAESSSSVASDVLLIVGTLIPSIAVVVGNWAFVRFFFWASGLKHL